MKNKTKIWKYKKNHQTMKEKNEERLKKKEKEIYSNCSAHDAESCTAHRRCTTTRPSCALIFL